MRNSLGKQISYRITLPVVCDLKMDLKLVQSVVTRFMMYIERKLQSGERASDSLGIDALTETTAARGRDLSDMQVGWLDILYSAKQ